MRIVLSTQLSRTRSVSLLTSFLCFSLCLCNKSFAGNGFFFQKPAKDSVPQKTIAKLKISVRDRNDGGALDSVYVSVGNKKGYTDRNGYIEFDSVKAIYPVSFSKSGYYSDWRTAKPSILLHLSKKEGKSPISTINNGMYERPGEHFSGSATVVSGSELRKISSLSFADALQFYDPSVIVTRDNNYGDNPNITPGIKLKGANHFPASATIEAKPGTINTGVQVNASSNDFIADQIGNPNQPAFFVNGVQVALRSALDIDINRIQKITILKDAAATAVYGVRGGQGVILIETLRPQEGKLRVSYSGQVQVAEADLSSYQIMSAKEKLAFEMDNGFYANAPELYQSRLNQVNKSGQTDWLKLPLRQAIGSKHLLALDGGSENMSYGLDFSYNDVQGAMKGAFRKTTSFGGYMSSRIKNVEFNNHLTYYNINATQSPYGSFDQYTWQNGYWNPYDTVTGKMTKLLEEVNYLGTKKPFYNPAYNGTLSTKDATDYSRIANTTNIDWNMGHGFKINGLLAYSRQAEQINQFLPPGHTEYADYSPANFFKRGNYFQNNSVFTSTEAALRLHYNKKIGLNQIYVSAGGSAIQTGSEAAGISISGFTSDKLTDIAFGSGYDTKRPTTNKVVTRLASGFGNLTYSYDNRYQAEVSGNADASSQFGNNQQVAPHWSAGASWNLHQERFFRTNKVVDLFRLRASIGTTGDYSFLSYLGRTSFNYYTDKQYILAGSTTGTRGIGLGAFLTGFANDSLSAPQTFQQNIGIDAQLLQSRLSIRVDAYRQKTSELILPITSPAYTGFQGFSYYDNLGAIENKGVAFTVNYALIRNTPKSIYWNISVNGLHNENRIAATSNFIDQFNEANNDMEIDQTKPQDRFVVGQSLSGIWAVRSLGIDANTGEELYVKADGSQTSDWNAADKVLIADMTPKWQGTFGTSVIIKNISAGIYFNYQMGAEGYNQTLADKVENASMLYNTDERAAGGRWKQPRDQAAFKPVSLDGLVTSPTYVTSRFVQDNDFVNCSAVSMSYALPQGFAAKIHAQSLRIGLMGNNIFQWQAMKAERGIYYPFQRQYTFSINTTF
ncbi:SusC/RagA family TonB-linked outer membrane protein [Chitinophagaceae bacterium LB-8]|uniref:SusC/RagA family TonB-linked outer membrane protein n=1 Tax=Paraflavisolibacter caeni TaxID=2982496 RepID=A0A9X3B739_9BACT|nr:SusC/RagA family TonB-linked outer membrane protein [Paraflavisolibacter caeni]MCU7548810.1 SusC/RagA family TonB-linked outer membrane protein [Paraflavisolibacter caeni]